MTHLCALAGGGCSFSGLSIATAKPWISTCRRRACDRDAAKLFLKRALENGCQPSRRESSRATGCTAIRRPSAKCKKKVTCIVVAGNEHGGTVTTGSNRTIARQETATGHARTAHEGDSGGRHSGDRGGTDDSQRPGTRDHPAEPAWGRRGSSPHSSRLKTTQRREQRLLALWGSKVQHIRVGL